MQPEVNVKIIEAIAYTPMNTAVMDLLPKEVIAFPGMIMTEEYRQKSETITLKAFTGKGLELRSKIWKDLKR